MDENNPNPQPENTFNKDEFNSFVKEALNQIKKIGEAYKKLFDAPEGQQSVVAEIETRLEDTKQKYEHLFSTNEAGLSRVAELNTQIEEIKKYHQELIGGATSIQAVIKESQDKITDFYVYLFGGTDGVEGQEPKVKTAIESILNFHTDLTKDDGYKKAVEDAHKEIIEAHDDLFQEDEEGNSKISSLNNDIEQIKTFKGVLEKDIEPFIKETKDDIDAKRRDVAALLDGATGGSLVEGFLKSKKEYKQEPDYKKLNGTAWENIGAVFSNMSLFVFSVLQVLIDYTLFVFPLLLSVFIFIQPDLVASIVGIKAQEATVSDFLGSLNFYGRLIISLPLWWISWFGQRSISHKRRLAEEYNHKAQVTKMYLNFVSKETENSYPLEAGAKNTLHDELIKVIARHPGQVYGKDETMLDKVIQLVCAGRGGKMETIDDKPEK